MIAALRNYLLSIPAARSPDIVIGGHENPYLLRWYVIPRNPVFNIYLHVFMRSDDDRALHDHPWVNFSWLLLGTYVEHQIQQGGIHLKIQRVAGDWVFRRTGKISHRIELINGSCITLFITGPRYRQWGFHCPEFGWVHWKKFTNPKDPGDIGKGCDQ